MLTEKRKADREKMAAAVIALAAEFGLAAERADIPEYREIRVEFRTPRGLGLGVDFSGTSNQIDVLCLPWHVRGNIFDDARPAEPALSDAFGREMAASLNTVHRHKCTAFAYGFDDMMDKMRRGLEMDRDGTAYDAAATIKVMERGLEIHGTPMRPLPTWLAELATA